MAEHPLQGEDGKVEHRLVELGRMAGEVLAVAHEDEAPGHVGGEAHDFGVHQVAQADEAARQGHAHREAVEHEERADLRAADVEDEGDEHADDAAVAGQALVAREDPSRGRVTEGENHLKRVGQEVFRLVEEAVPQARPDEHAEEAVEEQRLEQFLTDALTAVEVLHDEVGQSEAYHPAEGVETDVEAAYGEQLDGRVPGDE